jgi:hypothetical protein
VESATSIAGVTVTQTASMLNIDPIHPGADVVSGNASWVTRPTASVTSLEGGVKTSININSTISRDSGSGTAKSTSTETSPAPSSTTSASAASAVTVFEQSALSLSLLPFCGSIMLITALIAI